MGLQGQVCSETGLGTWKAHGFPASLTHRKTAASHPNVARFTGPCDRTMPNLSEAQSKGLSRRTFETATAQSGRWNAVIAALTFTGGFSAVRQRLRGRLCDCADRSAPSPNRIDVRARFRAADAMGLAAVEVQPPRARRRSDNALHSLGIMRAIAMTGRGLRA